MSGMTRGAVPIGSSVKLTYDDFVHFPDDGKRHELIDGEHYVTPSPNTKHQRILAHLFLLIGSWLEKHRFGEAFLSPFDVVFTQFDVVEPDLLYMSNERAALILTDLNVQGVPELVIEIASPSTRKRDALLKRALYERTGVSEYWIVEPKGERIRVYRGEGANFNAPIDLTREAGDVLTTPLLPGLDLPLARIFRA